MNGYGFHWSRCNSGGGIAATGGTVVLILAAAAYIVPRLAWVAGITAACVVLSVVLALTVVPRLARWSDSKDAEAYPVPLRAEPVQQVAPPQQTAIAPQVVNFNFYGADAARAAAVIRQAIPRKDK